VKNRKQINQNAASFEKYVPYLRQFQVQFSPSFPSNEVRKIDLRNTVACACMCLPFLFGFAPLKYGAISPLSQNLLWPLGLRLAYTCGAWNEYK